MLGYRQSLVIGSMVVVLAGAGIGADFFPTAARREGFDAALAEQDAAYDPNAKMLRAPFSSPGYHTTLASGDVHRTRESLTYAVALLDSGEDARLERAVEIIRRVIALQNQDPASETYGIWPWFLEEPLEQMSPPDWNWADFCGTQLLQVAIDHAGRLPADLQEEVEQSILHAGRAIQKRNVGPGYTNIAIMGAYVTLVAGERFGDGELLAYGRARLRRFYDYTLEKGSFSEYNSPTYTVVAIETLSRLLAHVRDADSRRLATELNDFAWRHLTRHFHAPTKQWAGPHSRAYATLLDPSVLAFIQRGTNGKMSFMGEAQAYESLDAHRIPLACPEDLFDYFVTLREPRIEREAFVMNASDEHDVIGTTYLHPDFTLGSVNIGDLWNQRRPLVAYWNAPSGVAALRLRCLHDDYDFACASLYTIQDAADVLGAVVFATDRGDTHISLDRIANATIQAQDLRVRLQFEGAPDDLKLPTKVEIGKPIDFTSGKIEGKFTIHAAKLGDSPGTIEIGRDADGTWIDVVLYRGVQRDFDLREIKEAQVVFTLSLMASSILTIPDPAVYPTLAGSMVVEGQLTGSRQKWFWRRSDRPSMTLTVPVAPLASSAQTAASAALLDTLDPWKAAY
ncbi:MAG: hypothetical protein JW993_02400 [Sedimentisphaerales bacterium]|nr:hypothetical protein [Sedimentisphaerales bacterium]